jgi:Tfp pilus assembly major pilin PilA
MKPSALLFRSSSRLGFTLAEIIVSVAVLVAILVVAGRVFNTAQQVSNVGAATADVMQEAVAIERQIRDDIARMSPSGVLAIHSVSVPNDQRIQDWNGQGPRPGLVNPGNTNAQARVRCDQLVFFTDGINRIKQLGSDGYRTVDQDDSAQTNWFPKLLAEGSMIYYGHGVQFPELLPCNVNPDSADTGEIPLLYGHDIDFVELRKGGDTPENPNGQVPPWYDGGSTPNLPTIHRKYPRAATNSDYSEFTIDFDQIGAAPIIGTQPEARKWVLARQETIMGDDDQQLPGLRNKRIYLSRGFGSMSLFPVDPRWAGSFGNIHFETIGLLESGRVDLAGMRFAGLREALSVSRDPASPNSILPANRSWDSFDSNDVINRAVLDAGSEPLLPGTGPEQGTQRELIKSLVRWPRVERVPPGQGRFDQHLSIPALGSACSSFIVEWTWDEKVGNVDTVKTSTAGNGQQTDTSINWIGLKTSPKDSWNGTGEAFAGRRWFGLYDSNRQVMPAGKIAGMDSVGWQGFAEVYPPDAGATTHAPSSIRLGVNAQTREGEITDPAYSQNSIEDASYPSGFGGNEDSRRIDYWAVFGLNRNSPLLDIDIVDNLKGEPNGTGFNTGDGRDDFDPSFTPWPTALRFTMVLHDPKTRLENGQVLQFVVRLPERCQP